MSAGPQDDITQVLLRIGAGEESAREQLFQRVYVELKTQAARLMRGERASHTLQTTALVHEAFLKLCGSSGLENAVNRGYFFGAAAQAMRQILVDHARARASQKRGGDREKLPLDEMLDATARAASPQPPGDSPVAAIDAILSLNSALEKLASMNERQHRVVMLRFFGGLTMPQIAEALGKSLATVEADFRVARAWLRSELS